MSTAAHSLKLTLGNYIGVFFSSLRGLVIAKLLGPAQYGVWCALNVVISYSQFSHLGLLYAQTKEVPFFKEKGDKPRVMSIFANTFTFSVLVSAVFSLGVAFFAFRALVNKNLFWGTALLLTGIVCILDQVYRFYINYLRANEEFDLLYKYNLLFSFSSLVLLSLGAYFFKFNGLMAAFILSYVLIAVYIMVIHNKKLPFTVQLGVVKGLIKVGFPLMVYGLTHVLFATIDRLIIMWQLDIKSLGYYSFASSIAEMAGIFSSGIGFVYFPKLIREFAARGNPADLQKTFSNITKALMLVGPFFLSVTFLGSILLIRGWYKNYLDAMVPLAFILLGKYFMIISSITGSVFIAINDIKSLMKATFAVVIITAILDLFAVAAGFKINGIALASLAGGILYAVLTLYMAIKRMGSKDFSCITDSVRYFLLMVIQFFIIFVITGNNIGIALPENYRGISLAISIIFLAVSSAYLLKKIFKTEFVKELAVYFKGLSRRKGPDLFYDELQGSQ